jgi:hypothetical protein
VNANILQFAAPKRHRVGHRVPQSATLHREQSISMEQSSLDDPARQLSTEALSGNWQKKGHVLLRGGASVQVRGLPLTPDPTFVACPTKMCRAASLSSFRPLAWRGAW